MHFLFVIFVSFFSFKYHQIFTTNSQTKGLNNIASYCQRTMQTGPINIFEYCTIIIFNKSVELYLALFQGCLL